MISVSVSVKSEYRSMYVSRYYVTMRMASVLPTEKFNLLYVFFSRLCMQDLK